MKAVIIGGGSIGKRHSQNLNNLNISTRIVDIDEIENIDNILNEGFDMGLVCTPNINHIEHCLKLVKFNLPIFCEKPFYTNIKGINNLLSLVNKKNLITMVGCNLRFTPEIKKINPTTKYINVYFGYDLKKWRPQTDHLKSYSANKKLGGGVVVGRIEFKNGTIADFTLNYLLEEYQRYYDILEDEVLKRKHITIDNQMYIDEIVYFIDCVKHNKKCMNNFQEAHNLLKKLI